MRGFCVRCNCECHGFLGALQLQVRLRCHGFERAAIAVQ